MTNKIPNSVIGAVSSVLAEYYYSHSTLNSLFMESGAPGNVPEGNCETKCSSWLRRCNDDPAVDPLQVLGQVIQKFMDQEPNDWNQKIGPGQERIRASLAKNQLTYQMKVTCGLFQGGRLFFYRSRVCPLSPALSSSKCPCFPSRLRPAAVPPPTRPAPVDPS